MQREWAVKLIFGQCEWVSQQLFDCFVFIDVRVGVERLEAAFPRGLVLAAWALEPGHIDIVLDREVPLEVPYLA